MEPFSDKQFIDFFVDYRIYGSYKTTEPTILPDGRKQIGPYSKDGFTSIDVYQGSEDFSGKYTISHGKSIILTVGYEGKIINGHSTFDPSVIYSSLKEALRTFPRDQPWVRGQSHIKIGNNLIYSNTSIGKLFYFENREMILTSNYDVIYEYRDQVIS